MSQMESNGVKWSQMESNGVKLSQIGFFLPGEFGLVSVGISLKSLNIMSLLIVINEFPSPLFDLLPHLWKLSLVSIERNEDLI